MNIKSYTDVIQLFQNLRHTDKTFIRSIKNHFWNYISQKWDSYLLSIFYGFFLVIFYRKRKLRFSYGHFRPTNFSLMLIDAIYNYILLWIQVKESHLNSKNIFDEKKYVQKLRTMAVFNIYKSTVNPIQQFLYNYIKTRN